MIKHVLATVAKVVTFALAFTMLPAIAEASPVSAHESTSIVSTVRQVSLPVKATIPDSSSDVRSPAPSSAATSIPVATPAILPVLGLILSFIVRYGVKHVIKVFGKTALKKALKQKLLARNANTWNHVMQTRHNWHWFGAKGDRNKVADLLASTVANGKKYPRGSGADQYEWVHQGKRITALVSKKTGEISDGWVK